jgi:hypothetical protein
MLSLEPIFARTKDFTTRTQEIIFKTCLTSYHFLKKLLSLVQKIYKFLNMLASKTYNFLITNDSQPKQEAFLA